MDEKCKVACQLEQTLGNSPGAAIGSSVLDMQVQSVEELPPPTSITTIEVFLQIFFGC